jgi:hypothetical protein
LQRKRNNNNKNISKFEKLKLIFGNLKKIENIIRSSNAFSNFFEEG